MAGTRALVVGLMLAVVGCKKPLPTGPTLEEDALVKLMRARDVPNISSARLSVKMHSKPLGIAAPPLAGGLVIERPNRAYIVVKDPIGSPVLTITTDGDSAAMMNSRDKEWIVAEDAAMSLGSATEGQISMDDVVSLLLGLVPVGQDMVKDRRESDEGVHLDIEGPGGTSLDVLMDAVNATPRSVTVDDKDGRRLVNATYDPFSMVGESWMPTHLLLEVPSVELKVNVRYKTWKPLETAPDVFKLDPPKGFTVIPMDDYVTRMSAEQATTD